MISQPGLLARLLAGLLATGTLLAGEGHVSDVQREHLYDCVHSPVICFVDHTINKIKGPQTVEARSKPIGKCKVRIELS